MACRSQIVGTSPPSQSGFGFGSSIGLNASHWDGTVTFSLRHTTSTWAAFATVSEAGLKPAAGTIAHPTKLVHAVVEELFACDLVVLDRVDGDFLEQGALAGGFGRDVQRTGPGSRH